MSNPVIAAGGVVYRELKGIIEVVLVVPVNEPDRWALPKGHREQGESIVTAALREVREETGLTAEILEDLGYVTYFYRWQGQLLPKEVHYFLMEPVGGDFTHHDQEMSTVLWVPLHQALQQITFDTERTILERAKKKLGV